MKIIGITGPTGAGKTTALNVLEKLGVCILDADAVYHGLLEGSAPLQEALIGRYGDICDETGRIDRKKLGNVVFGDPEALLDLNAITHRFVGVEMDSRIRRAEAEGRPGVAIDAIGLVESGLAEQCDARVAVIAPAEVRIRRIMARENISEAYARKRVAAQKDEAFFRDNCDYTLENTEDDTPEAFGARALTLFQIILDR